MSNKWSGHDEASSESKVLNSTAEAALIAQPRCGQEAPSCTPKGACQHSTDGRVGIMHLEAMLTSQEQCHTGQKQDVHVWLPSAMRQHSHSAAHECPRMCSSLVQSQRQSFMLHLQVFLGGPSQTSTCCQGPCHLPPTRPVSHFPCPEMHRASCTQCCKSAHVSKRLIMAAESPSWAPLVQP